MWCAVINVYAEAVIALWSEKVDYNSYISALAHTKYNSIDEGWKTWTFNIGFDV